MQLLKELERYIDQTLGLHIEMNPWGGEGELSYLLKETYAFQKTNLFGRPVLLMVDRQKEQSPPAMIKKHLEQVHQVWPEEIIYVREQLTANNRNRLIQGKVSFVVPGNQLYLPLLAIDLREHFRAERKSVKKVSPAAQAVVLQAVYKHRRLFDEGMTLTEWAAELGYTKMSMTRAFRDLRTVFEDEEFDQELHGRELWDRLHSFLRSPVRKQRYYAAELPAVKGCPLAGDNALARYTMMAEPNQKTVCMIPKDWKTFQERFQLVELERPEPGALKVQIWNYSPALFSKQGVADPLSVWLSYGKNRDERVEMALDELLEDVSW